MAAPPTSTPPPPEMNSWTGEPDDPARPNEVARNKYHRRMLVQIPGRIKFTTTYNSPISDRAQYDESKHSWPKNKLVPVEAEKAMKAKTVQYLWVGIMDGESPKSHLNKTSGRQKGQGATKPGDEEPLAHDRCMMPVVIKCDTNIPDSAMFFVLCGFSNSPADQIRFARPISFDKASIFFFEEFLGPTPQEVFTNLRTKLAEDAIKASCRYWCSKSKNRKGGSLVEQTTDRTSVDLPDTPLAVTTVGPGTSDEGVHNFFLGDGDSGFDEDDAKKMIRELTNAHSVFPPDIPRALVVRIRDILSIHTELFGRLFRSALPFFLEECLSNWPASINPNMPSDQELQVVRNAIGAQERYLRYAGTVLASDER